jgi:hypothetical protein
MVNMFADYPSRPIGGGNPYHCCVFCERSAPQLFGHLERHGSYCLYRRTKEAVIAGNKDEMLDLYVEMEDRDNCYALRIELEKELGLTNTEVTDDIEDD